MQNAHERIVETTLDPDDVGIDKDNGEKFTALDIMRMSAGLVLLACVLGKVLTGSALWGWNWHKEAVSLEPSAFWSDFELPVEFTPLQLGEFSGDRASSEKPILLAIRSKVFDVSARPSMYGSWGPYRKFTGKDCSRAFSYSWGDWNGLSAPCDASLDGLSVEQLGRVDSWLEFFLRKYPMVGYVVPERIPAGDADNYTPSESGDSS
ncbi:LAFE_0A01706g1_1 [Lachancea fermentati]|uniref:LAFE_0A01706g1_1 n=1 Tax=Lachancea fermentati TaxID=4955 RepID=A0A1G4M6B9_LACFM|nr:LAFE_0A01706g1_1 [Lachancea fermentati]